MRVLELFCGTKSVGKVCREKDWEVISVDIDKKFKPDICCDIKDFDYKKYPVGHFDIIWASPPCTYFSRVRLSNIGKWNKEHNKTLTRELCDNDLLEKGLPPLYKTLDIIEYLKPKYFFIENPQTGQMKNHIDLPYIDVDYCRFNFNYKKRTRIWNNRENMENKLCLGKNNCEFMEGNKHLERVGDGKCKLSKIDKYRIPSGVIEYLFFDITKN
jgi:hypothetical protein